MSRAPNDFNTDWVQTLNLWPPMPLVCGKSPPGRWVQISSLSLTLSVLSALVYKWGCCGFSLRRPV